MTKIYSALALLLATTSPSFADEPVTKWQWGCEWQQASNGNYWFKVDGGCRHWIALGYATQASMNKDVPPATEDDSEEPSDPGDGGTDPGEGPGDDEGPDDDGGNGAEGPGDNGGGNEGPCDEGPSKPGKDRPGKPGKPGKGRA